MGQSSRAWKWLAWLYLISFVAVLFATEDGTRKEIVLSTLLLAQLVAAGVSRILEALGK